MVALAALVRAHNLCAWPQCDQPCENFATFLHHLATVHPFDERAAQQCRAQIEVVDNLEHRLSKERTRLHAMMQHLHMKQSPDTTTPTLGALQQPQDVATISSPALAEQKTESLPEQAIPQLAQAGQRCGAFLRQVVAGTVLPDSLTVVMTCPDHEVLLFRLQHAAVSTAPSWAYERWEA
ncbi:unnamed protein product [Gongylonema pulchrum]|uniref:FOXP-CC domain-containing protein n=1 Tax=Gongylonema pulchrum TaxID=637853 RepID=A0A183E6S7_9BILA|nr:unnamed protein product [Gongylonema pulchrum]